MSEPRPSPVDPSADIDDGLIDDGLIDDGLIDDGADLPASEPPVSVDPAVPDPEPDETGPSSIRNVVEWVAILAGALVVALVVTRFLIQAFFIPSLSMFPTLDIDDRVLVNKLSYNFGEVNRGDLVVFERPPGEADGSIKDLVKRVVAVGGETVESRDGQLYINGAPLDEPYLPAGMQTNGVEATVIPGGHVFVMGDNRGDSRDSRFFGPLPEELIIGRAFVKVWPPLDIGLL